MVTKFAQQNAGKDKEKPKGKNEKQYLIDHYDGTFLEKPERSETEAETMHNQQKTIESRKRKERSPNDSEQNPGQPIQKHKDASSYSYTSSDDNEGNEDNEDNGDDTETVFEKTMESDEGTMTCACKGEIAVPKMNEQIPCIYCNSMVYRCNCPNENVKIVNKYQQQRCNLCEYTYVPDGKFLNLTA